MKQATNVNYKQPLAEHVLLPTPPLPPLKGRRRVQRSYSSEMLTSDSYYNVNEYGQAEACQLPTESSGYQSGSLSKQKSSTATGRGKLQVFLPLPASGILELNLSKYFSFFNFPMNLITKNIQIYHFQQSQIELFFNH